MNFPGGLPIDLQPDAQHGDSLAKAARHNDLERTIHPLLVAQPLGAAVTHISQPNGVLVVDSAGWICSADAAAAAWICEIANKRGVGPWYLAEVAGDASLEEDLHRLFAGAPVSSTVASLPGGGATLFDTSIRWTLISGDLGQHAVLTLEPVSQAEDPTTIDALTQLPDRRAIPTRIAEWRRAAASDPPPFAVLFVDFNDFKSVNDQHGHLLGDLVLQTIAARLQQSIRDGDLAARYGGDEFVLLIRNAALPADIEPVLARLLAAIEQPICVSGLTLQIHATIGWATPHGDDWTTESLIAAADADMYARKRAVLR